MKIDRDVLNVLDSCRIEGAFLFLPDRQLERSLYVKTNKVLEILGGKWNRKAKAHLFPEDPTELLDAVIQTEEVVDPKKVFQFFPTPVALVDRMISLASVKATDKALEPSVGKGAIAVRLLPLVKSLTSYELNAEMASTLPPEFNTTCVDFLSVDPESNYDVILMNPPFSKHQDVKHIMHAYKFLAPGGRLVAVASEGSFFRQDRVTMEFQNWLDTVEGTFEINPEGAFKSSGTGVRTRLVIVEKP